MQKLCQKIDKNQMKRLNLRLIFNQVQKDGAVSRAQLARETGLSSMATGRLVDEMIHVGLLEEVDNKEDVLSTVGRKSKMVQVSAHKIRNLGVEVAANHITVGEVDFYGNVIDSVTYQENFSRATPEYVCNRIAAMIQKKMCALKTGQRYHTCGVVSPGIIDCERGVIRFASCFHWKDVPLAELISKTTEIENVLLDNELKARSKAEELFGAAKGYEAAAVLNLGKGVGSSLIFRGEVFRGNANMAGELGHVCINPSGTLCQCGKRGCLQTFLSLDSILSDARKLEPSITAQEFFAAHQRGEDWAVRILEHMASYAAVAVEMLVQLYSAEKVILCGEIPELYPDIAEIIGNHYHHQENNMFQKNAEICCSPLAERGNLLGAGTMAFYHELDCIFEQLC